MNWESVLKARSPMPVWVKDAINEIMSDDESHNLHDLISMIFKLRPEGSMDFPSTSRFKSYLDKHAQIQRTGRQLPIYRWKV